MAGNKNKLVRMQEPRNKKSLHPSSVPGFVPRRPCKYYEKGHCVLGDQCTFIHAVGVNTPGSMPPGSSVHTPGSSVDTPGSSSVVRDTAKPTVAEGRMPERRNGYLVDIPQGSCKWFVLTGMCIKGKQCKYDHPQSNNSRTLIIKNLFHHPDLHGGMLDKETRYDVKNLLNAYCVFYYALLGKLSSIGNVVMFKCSCNVASYLQGTVFVQYATRDCALKALATFNGKMYGERVMDIELVPVSNWRAAVCSKAFYLKEGHREETCGLIHAFPNPNNAFPLSEGICDNFTTYGWCDSDAACQRRFQHPIPDDSPVVIIPNHFDHPYLNRSSVVGKKEEERLIVDLKLSYCKVYKSCMNLFRTWGSVKSCVCAINQIPNLRGNIYVTYATCQEACKAVAMLKSLQTKCSICPKSALQKCRRFKRGCCTKLDKCTRLHLLKNPVEKPGNVVGAPEIQTSIHQKQESIDNTFSQNMPTKLSRVDAHSAGSSLSEFPEEHKQGQRQQVGDRRNLSKNLESLHELAHGTLASDQTAGILNTPISEHVRLFNESLSKLSCSQPQSHNSSKSRTSVERQDDDRKSEDDCDEYYVHISQLPRHYDKSDIYHLFKAYEGIKDVDIPEPESSYRKEFSAFVIFENRLMAEKVLRVEHLVDGKLLRLDGFDPSGGVSPSPERSRSRSKSHQTSSPLHKTTRSRSPLCNIGKDSSDKSAPSRSHGKDSPSRKIICRSKVGRKKLYNACQ